MFLKKTFSKTSFIKCLKHGRTKGYRSKTRIRCSKCNIEAVSKRRIEIKKKAIQYKGGKCSKCGYSKCKDALEFHHKLSKKKDFGISKRGYTRSWERVKKELDKCILLCANCHREQHFKAKG